MEPIHFDSLYPQDSRFNEIEKIMTFIKGGNSCQVISLPGAGKSTLFGLLSYNRKVRLKHLGESQASYHFVLCNFSEIREKSLFEAQKFIFLCLLTSLRDRGKEEEHQRISEIFKESLKFSDELVLFDGLKKAIDLLALEKNLNIIFIFNKFDEYIPMVTLDFFSNLKALRDRAKYHFSVIFSLTRPLEQIIDPSIFSDFFQFVAGHTIFLPILDKPSLDFRLSYIEKLLGKKLDPKLKDELIRLTGGHAKMARVCLEEVLALGDQKESKDLWEYLLNNRALRSVSYEIWQAFSPFEQEALKKLLLKKPIDNDTKNFFTNLGLVKDGKLAIAIFEEFVKYRIKHLTLEKIIYKEETNDILKGEIVLTDKLTSYEFRLLRFLLQNSGRILERDEIINNVWKNEKSTAGVTDEALDQLIFRLRKKIEDDPNNPVYLQTIKGRGFRFIP